MVKIRHTSILGGVDSAYNTALATSSASSTCDEEEYSHNREEISCALLTVPYGLSVSYSSIDFSTSSRLSNLALNSVFVVAGEIDYLGNSKGRSTVDLSTHCYLNVGLHLSQFSPHSFIDNSEGVLRGRIHDRTANFMTNNTEKNCICNG